MTAAAAPAPAPAPALAGAADGFDWRPVLIVAAGIVVLYLLTRATTAPAVVKDAAPADVKE